MGLFATFGYVNGAWISGDVDGAPSLVIDIHDSDIAAVRYSPAAGASGRFYLGVEPRIYFEDEAASEPVDAAAEASGFVGWIREVNGRDVDPASVEALLASPNPDDDPVDVFVEETVEKLLDLVGLPLPKELQPEAGQAGNEPAPDKRRGWFRRG